MFKFISVFILLLLSVSIQVTPLAESSSANNFKEIDKASNTNNQSAPAFTYNYPASLSQIEKMESNPFRVMQQMLSEMEQRFNSMFGDSNITSGQGIQSSSSLFSSQSGMDSSGFFGSFFNQPCRQSYGEKELVIKCNVTDYDPEQVKVDVKGNQLTISGKSVKTEEDGQNSTVQFKESLYLSDFNMEKMTSDTSNGVLTVTVPRIPHQITDGKKDQNVTEIA